MRQIKLQPNRFGRDILMKAIRLVAIASLPAAAAIASTLAMPVKALETFGNNGIQLDADTIVEFEFVESNGAYQSSFGVINLDTGEKTALLVEAKPADTAQDVERPSSYTDETGASTRRDFKGTPGNAVPRPLVEFTFKANTRYAFYLESTINGRPAGILYSTDAQNPNNRQQTQFEGGFTTLGDGNGAVIRWDDTGAALVRTTDQDRDFDDFIVRAGGFQNCKYDETITPAPPPLDR